MVFRVRSQEGEPSLELAKTDKTEFIVSINHSNENDNVNYHTAIKNIFLTVPNITKLLLHRRVDSTCIWDSFHQFLTTSKSLQELTLVCRLTLEQTTALSKSLIDNKTLKTLHMRKILEREDELWL